MNQGEYIVGKRVEFKNAKKQEVVVGTILDKIRYRENYNVSSDVKSSDVVDGYLVALEGSLDVRVVKPIRIMKILQDDIKSPLMIVSEITADEATMFKENWEASMKGDNPKIIASVDMAEGKDLQKTTIIKDGKVVIEDRDTLGLTRSLRRKLLEDCDLDVGIDIIDKYNEGLTQEYPNEYYTPGRVEKVADFIKVHYLEKGIDNALNTCDVCTSALYANHCCEKGCQNRSIPVKQS